MVWLEKFAASRVAKVSGFMNPEAQTKAAASCDKASSDWFTPSLSIAVEKIKDLFLQWKPAEALI